MIISLVPFALALEARDGLAPTDRPTAGTVSVEQLVSGTVSGSDGPAAGVHVVVLVGDHFVAHTHTDAHGRFSISPELRVGDTPRLVAWHESYGTTWLEPLAETWFGTLAPGPEPFAMDRCAEGLEPAWRELLPGVCPGMALTRAVLLEHEQVVAPTDLHEGVTLASEGRVSRWLRFTADGRMDSLSASWQEAAGDTTADRLVARLDGWASSRDHEEQRGVQAPATGWCGTPGPPMDTVIRTWRRDQQEVTLELRRVTGDTNRNARLHWSDEQHVREQASAEASRHHATVRTCLGWGGLHGPDQRFRGCVEALGFGEDTGVVRELELLSDELARFSPSSSRPRPSEVLEELLGPEPDPESLPPSVAERWLRALDEEARFEAEVEALFR